MAASPKRFRKRIFVPDDGLEEGEIVDEGPGPSENHPNTKKVESLTEPFTDGYDENLMGDAADRDRLEAMSELEREKELYSRCLRREELRRKHEIRLQLAKGRSGTAPASGSASVEASEPPEDMGIKERAHLRRSNLRAGSDQRATALGRLLAERSNKLTKESKWSGDQQKIKLKARDIYSDDSSSSSDDSSQTSQSVASSSVGNEQSRVTMREQLSRVVLTRRQLESFLDKPLFEKTVVDCYVRVNNSICQIVGLQEGSSYYKLSSKSTNLLLRMRYGNHERVSHMDVVSNQPITSQQFHLWMTTWQRDLKELPLLSDISKKQMEIENATEYSYTENDVERIVQSRRQAAPKPVSAAYKKIQLFMQRDIAVGLNDMDKVESLEKQIKELETSSSSASSAPNPAAKPGLKTPQPPQPRVTTTLPNIHRADALVPGGTKRGNLVDRPPKPDDCELEQYMRRKYKKSSVVSRSRVEVDPEDWGEESLSVPAGNEAAAGTTRPKTPDTTESQPPQPELDLYALHNFHIPLNTNNLASFATIFKDTKFH